MEHRFACEVVYICRRGYLVCDVLRNLVGIKMKIFKIEFTTGLLGERRERPQKTSTKGRSCNLCFTNNFPWKSDETKSIK